MEKLQDLDLARSPHLERDSIGEALDLDLLSPFPQKYATNSGGIKRTKQEPKVNNGGERMEGKGWFGRRWKRGIYRGPRNIAVGAEKRSDPRPKRYYRLSKRYYRSRANCAENGQKTPQTGSTTVLSGTTAWYTN